MIKNKEEMSRLITVAGLVLATCASATVARGAPAGDDRDPARVPGELAAKTISLGPGPHLLLDDYLVDRSASKNVVRRVTQVQRFLQEPVVTSGAGHGCFQPWVTVLREPATGRFRMWYNATNLSPAAAYSGPHLAYLESADGIQWPRNMRRLDSVQLTYGASIIDDGPEYARPAERFKQMFQHVPQPYSGKWESRVAFSADGLQWREYEGNPVFRPPFGDMNNTYWDPVRKRYGLVIRSYEKYAWTNAEGRKEDRLIRLYYHSTSTDYRRWTQPTRIITPDEQDPGVTEWYGVGGVMCRGGLLIGMLKVLRDDVVRPQAPAGAFGYGYTVLAWSRDGEHWAHDRHTDIFFDADSNPKAWDYAHTWVDSALTVGAEVYLYYGGYKWGHKSNRTTERQIGLAKIRRDRYAAREAGTEGGTLRTPLVELRGNAMTLNVDAHDGEARVQILDPDGRPLPGFALSDCQPVRGDSLDAPVQWQRPLAAVEGKPVRLEFSLRNARLYAFCLRGGDVSTPQ